MSTESDNAYQTAGVDYGVLDAAKRSALAAARSTITLPEARGASVVAESIGEPVTLLEVDGVQLAVVLECLGTKSMIARAVEERLGLNRWDAVGTDTVAAIVNDLCCAGALPISVNGYVATGSAEWYSAARHASFVEGWRRACATVGAAWVGGESPTLAGIVDPGQVDLAGSALGRIPSGREPWLPGRIEPGDEIVLVSSSGLHANGASLARAVADRLDAGWATPLPSGRSFGDAVLDPSPLYAPLVEHLQAEALPVHYATHVTGHGWRKLMRPDRELTYRVSAVPDVPEVLAFLAEEAGLEPGAAYGTLNMGAGFALYVAKGAGSAAVATAAACGHRALVGGAVEGGPRQVVIEPLSVTYSSGDLELR